MMTLLLFHALSVLPLALAHMQMRIPSPLRDPHSNRTDEPKDYNILNPLNADGSNFACKGYQFNTPWTPVANYQAGGTYQMTLEGSATHGGGSCQLSLSCDGGFQFKVIRSMIGGCPLQLSYDFTIPSEFGRLNGATCLFAWTWFNKIGNREMYMNCAVVNIVPRKSQSHAHSAAKSNSIDARDTSKANSAAQAALSSYPDLFVANLASINKCVAKETQDVVFDNPGQDVTFGDDVSSSAKPSFKDGACIGEGKQTAGSASSSSTGASPAMSMGGDDDSTSQSSGSDGQWNPELYGGDASAQGTASSTEEATSNTQEAASSTDESQQDNLQPVDIEDGDKQPDPAVEQELDSYLDSLYTSGASNEQRDTADQQDSVVQDTSNSPSTEYADDEGSDFDPLHNPEDAYQYDLYYRRQRATRQKRWDSYKDASANGTQDENSTLATTSNDNIFADPQLAALIARLNDLGSTVFTLVKFASQFLDQPPASSVDDGVSAGASSSASDDLFGDDEKASVRRGDQPAVVQKRQDPAPLSNATVDSIIQVLGNIHSDLGQINNNVSSDAADQQSLKDYPNNDAIYSALFNKLDKLDQEIYSIYDYVTEPVPGSKKRANANIDLDSAQPTLLEGITKPLVELNDKMTELIQYAKEIAAAVSKPEAKPQGARKGEIRPTVHDIHTRPSGASARVWSRIKRTLSDNIWKRQDQEAPLETMGPQFAADGTPLPPGGNPQFAADGTPLPPGQNLADDTLVPLTDDPRGPEPTVISDPGQGLTENGAAEALFPDLDHSAAYQDPRSNDPAFDWSSVYGGANASDNTQSSGEPSLVDSGGEDATQDSPTDSGLFTESADPQLIPSAQPDSTEGFVAALPGGNLTVAGGLLVNGSGLFQAASSNQTQSAEAQQDTQQGFDWGTVWPGLAEHDKPRHGHSHPLINVTEPDQDQGQLNEAAAAPSGQPESAEEVDNTESDQDGDTPRHGQSLPLIVATEPDQDQDEPTEAEGVDGTESEQAGDGAAVAEPTDTSSDPAVPVPSDSAQDVAEGGPNEWWEDDNAAEETNPDDYQDEPAAEEPTSTVTEPSMPDPSELAQEFEGEEDSQAGTAIPVESESTPSPTTADSDSAIPSPDSTGQTLGEALRDAFPELAAQYSGQSPEESEGEWSEENDDNWTDGVLPGLFRTAKTSSRPHSKPKAKPTDDAAALLPYLLEPGPVIPEGVSVNWPSPTGSVDNLENMPSLTNDLGPDSEEQVLKFFAALKKYQEGTGPAPPVKRQESPQLLDPNDPFVGNDDDMEWLMSLFPQLRNDPNPLGSKQARQSVDNLETFPTVVDDLPASAEDDVRKWFADLAKSNKQPSPAAIKRLLTRQIATLPTLEELLGSPVVVPAAAAAPTASEPPVLVADVPEATTSEIPAIIPIIATPTTLESPDVSSPTPTPTALNSEEYCLQKKSSTEGNIAGWQKELAQSCGSAAPFEHYADPVFIAPFLALIKACNTRQAGLRDKITQYRADLVAECGGVLGVAHVGGVAVVGGGSGGSA